jgi:hypothetical protein
MRCLMDDDQNIAKSLEGWMKELVNQVTANVLHKTRTGY